MRWGWLVLALLLAAVAACRQANPTPTAQPAAAILQRASQTMGALDSFHFELEHQQGGTPLWQGVEMTRAVGDVARPGKLRTKVTAEMMGALLEMQVVTIGDTNYLTNPFSGRWEELPSGVSPVGFFKPDSGIAAILQGLTSPRLLAEEEAEGVLSYHVQGAVPSEALGALVVTPARGSIIQAELWVGKTDYLVRRLNLRGKLTPTERDGVIRVIRLSQFNQVPPIEPP